MTRRNKTETTIVPDLSVDHGQELVDTRRPVEALVDVLEQLGGDLAEPIELVVDTEQECLMQHCGDKGVGDAVSGDVREQNTRTVTASPEGYRQVKLALSLGLLDSTGQVVAPIEVDVDDVVPADRFLERNRDPADIHPGQSGDFARTGFEGCGDLLEVPELVEQTPRWSTTFTIRPFRPRPATLPGCMSRRLCRGYQWRLCSANLLSVGSHR